MADNTKKDPSIAHPIVIDMGKVRKKRIQQLKKGRGKLANEVSDAMEQVRESLGEDAGNKQLVPVVIIYRQKPKKRKMRMRGGMGLPFTY